LALEKRRKLRNSSRKGGLRYRTLDSEKGILFPDDPRYRELEHLWLTFHKEPVLDKYPCIGLLPEFQKEHIRKVLQSVYNIGMALRNVPQGSETWNSLIDKRNNLMQFFEQLVGHPNVKCSEIDPALDPWERKDNENKA